MVEPLAHIAGSSLPQSLSTDASFKCVALSLGRTAHDVAS